MNMTKTAIGLALMIALAIPAAADWNPEQPAKWVQFPDLTPMGIDVNASEPFILADDFECRVTGPITDIHLWGSWLWDYIPWNQDPAGVIFTLSIHKDIPADESPTGYSMPGDLLWMRTFQPGEFVVRVWQDQIEEGWMDPPDMWFFPADWTCWQYNFYIDPAEAFVQEGTLENPIVYWLDVQAQPLDPEARFGWKTSVDHWNDNAVWGLGAEPYPGPWQELYYPPGHELQGQPIDLAFVITTLEQPEEVDFGDAPDPSYPTLLASNGARHVIVPGLYLGAGVDGELDGQPDPAALGDDNDGFDDEDGVVFLTPLVPGAGAAVDVTASAPGVLDAWIDFGGDGSWAEPGDQIFAGMPLVPGVNNLTFPVPASAVAGAVTYARFRFSANGGLPFDGPAPDGEVEDYQVVIEGEPGGYLFEFSLDIGSDTELSDPQFNGNEAFDPGDVYWWQGPPVLPPGRDGFKDDLFIFNFDPWPDPPDPAYATRVPVGAGTVEDYGEFFDLDGHDQTDFSLIEAQFPIFHFDSQCVYPPAFLMISHDDDMAPGWPAMDVPVTVPSPAGIIHGTTPAKDEVMGVNVAYTPPAPPPYPILGLYPIADEVGVHQSLVPNPDNGDPEDDDVDSLDIVPGEDQCPYWFFSPDHEAFLGLDPGGIYEVTFGIPVQVIDEAFHLGIPEETDVDAFEFTWLESPDGAGAPPMLALLFSVDEDDPLTFVDESGGLDPSMIYVSWMTGFSMPFTDPLGEDVDALTIWREPLETPEACCLPDGTCLDTTPNDCLAQGGFPMGPGTSCATLPPMILFDLSDVAACENDNVQLQIIVCGAQPMTFQWTKDGAPIGGGGPTLSLPDIRPSDAGTYQVTVTNVNGTVTSSPAVVTVQMKGDSNCDGVLNAFDVDPFILALTDPAGWMATYPCDYLCANDINRDGMVNAFDVDPFVTCLTSGGCP